MKPLLRPATCEDGQFLYALHHEALGAVVEATWGSWDDDEQRRFHEQWFEPDRLSVVTVEGRPIGVLDVRTNGDVTYLARIELLPEMQGRGLGTELVRKLLEAARETGIIAVELDVVHHNEGARRFYERLGFRVVSDQPPKRRMRLDLR